MRIRIFITGFATCCAAMILAAMTVLPQDPGEGQDAFMEAMAKYGTPSAEHEALALRAGQWNAKTTFWMMPGAPPETHEGTAVFEMLLDGRYLICHFTMDYNGMPFEGAGMTGYDRMTDEYQSIWVDNMSTGILMSAGTEENGEMTMKGMAPDMMAGKYMPVRSVERIIDDSTFVMEMYATGPGGDEFKSMEITYTRVED